MIATLKFDNLSNYLDHLSGHISAFAYKSELSASEIKGQISCADLSDYVKRSETSGNTLLLAYPLSGVNGNEISGYLLCSDLNGKIGISTEADLSAYVMSHAKNIWIDDQVSGTGPVQSDLSILKMTNEAFALSALSGTVLSNQLVVIDDDYIDAYGQPICALIMYDSPDDDVSMRGIAATDKYVDKKVGDMRGRLKTFFKSVSATIAEKDTLDDISAGLLASISALYDTL